MALTNKLTAIGNAIRAKTGGTAALTLDEMVTAIGSISGDGGGGSTTAVTEKDVNFYDYEGTLLHSYTVAEAAALTALPDLPSHDGLICQGWNWSLEDIQAEGREVNVGAMYVTDDGATRLYIKLVDEVDLTAYVRFSTTMSTGATIDWGDGSTSKSTSSSNTQYSHTYAAVGEYVISISSQSGTISLTGSSGAYSVMGAGTSSNHRNANKLQKVELGSNFSSALNYTFQYCSFLTSITVTSSAIISSPSAFTGCYSLRGITLPPTMTTAGSSEFQYCYSLRSVSFPNTVKSFSSSLFQYCYSLRSVTIPSSITSVGSYVFRGCSNLERATIPNGVTSIGSYAFRECFSLRDITITNGVTTIGSYAFYTAYGLTRVTIPETVTSIAAYAFYNCASLLELHFKPATPPTLSNTNALTSTGNCTIYVPAGCLEAYQSATNWSTYASRMVEEDS